MTTNEQKLMEDYFIMKGIEACKLDPDKMELKRQIFLKEYIEKLKNGEIFNSMLQYEI